MFQPILMEWICHKSFAIPPETRKESQKRKGKEVFILCVFNENHTKTASRKRGEYNNSQQYNQVKIKLIDWNAVEKINTANFNVSLCYVILLILNFA